MAECIQKLAKPRMRGLHRRQTAMNIGIAITLSLITGGLFKHFVCDARKKAYADFYRNYDPDEAFLEMYKLDADFQSISKQSY